MYQFQRISAFFILFLCIIMPQARADIPLGQLQNSVPTLAPVIKDTRPAIVNIAARAKVDVDSSPDFRDPFEDPFFNDPFFRRFFEDFGGMQRFESPRRAPREREARSIGSGVIVDADEGHILTNHHVVRNADEIFVILEDKRKLEAEIIGSDPDTDVAVLKVKAKNLTAIPLGNSDQMDVGDYVLAIGNPFGLSHTVTSGIISALGRSGLGLEGYEDFIQTDAPINPGNSGGALINLKGELIGINTAIYSRSGGSMGIGFAIPVNMARSVMDQLLEHGEIKRGRIGVHIQDVSPEIAEALDLERLNGALVAQVAEDSPSDKAGIKTGDIITHFDGTEVKSSAHLKNLVGLMRLGDEAEVKLLRDGKPRNVEVKIGKVDEMDVAQEAGSVELLKGARFSSIPETHPMHGKIKGVYVSDVEYGSASWRSGLKDGDIITSVNKQAVSKVDDLVDAAKKKDKGILLNIRRGNAALFIVIN